MLALKHPMKADHDPEDIARGRFVSAFRAFILNDLASDLRKAYDERAAPAFARAQGRAPESSADAHKALRPDPAFKVYSLCRVNAQKMVWDAVIPSVERDLERLDTIAREADGPASFEADQALVPPRNVSAIDVHLMPGSYTGSASSSPMKQGAVYDRGLAVFSMGLMGQNLDDIGLSMAAYIKARYPDFKPARILDLGCTIGHNSLPWVQAYPDAQMDAIDVAAPGLYYGSTRAKLQGQNVRFRQMNAEQLDYPDNSVDLVFSSMFLHELSLKSIANVFKEARRVLKPGGLMLHMELPPNSQMGAFEGFYLDWDCYYNSEPFYKTFRDQDPRSLCEAAGFAAQDYLQFVVPSMGIYGDQAVRDAAAADPLEVNRETTGRLAEGVQWFGFGAWKR